MGFIVILIIIIMMWFFIGATSDKQTTYSNNKSNYNSYNKIDSTPKQPIKPINNTTSNNGILQQQTVSQENHINYDSLPYSDELMVRFCRVENEELICIDINKLEKTAVFRSRENPANHYFTGLNSCSCPDSCIPCKHMLHLANSLGILEKWKTGLPIKRYNEIVKSYINSQYSIDPKGWKKDTFGEH